MKTQHDKKQVADERFLSFASFSEKKSIRDTNIAITYCRVSTKVQFDNNASIQVQRNFCEEYAHRKGLIIIESFGGYESAKTDSRKEFNRMLKFVKTNKQVSTIIVYSYDRFSRTGGRAASLSDSLAQQGVQVVSATQEVNLKEASGAFTRDLFYLFSQFDNTLRADKVRVNSKEKLRNGYWIYAYPLGLTKTNPKAKAEDAKVIIDDKGKLIRKAFKMRADGVKTSSILEELKKRGLILTEKAISKIFRNTLYCGIITTKSLPDQVIQAKNVPKIVSEDLFLKVNNLLKKNSHGYKINEKYETLYLKNWMRCATCGQPYTGYMQQKKKYNCKWYYYKCRTTGCKKNRRDFKVNEQFAAFLSQFQLKEELREPVLAAMELHFESLYAEQNQEIELLETEMKKIQKKLDNVEEKYVTGEIEKSLYDKFAGKFKDELAGILQEIQRYEKPSSNLKKSLEMTLDLSVNLVKLWQKGGFYEKRKMLEMIFEKPAEYDYENGVFRTFFLSPRFELIHKFSKG